MFGGRAEMEERAELGDGDRMWKAHRDTGGSCKE